jgi:hypothetical protein
MKVRAVAQSALTYAGETIHRGWMQWQSFWFCPAEAAPLAVVRILTSFVLLYLHVASFSICLDVIGPYGWLDNQAWFELARMSDTARWSIWLWIASPSAIMLLHGLFILAIFGLAIGWKSRLCSVIVWLGQLNYIQRGFPLNYGLDCVVSFLTLYLMIGPCGDAFSLDTWLAQRRRSRSGSSRGEVISSSKSASANIALRCIQIHMCLVYISAGLSKLHGASWWSGVATYLASMNPEMWPVAYEVQWIGRHPKLVHALSNVSVWFTLFFEISFAFVIWHPRFRPAMLICAALLHLGIGVFMGLGAFGVTMLAGCSAFLAPDVCQQLVDSLVRWLHSLWRRTPGVFPVRVARTNTERATDFKVFTTKMQSHPHETRSCPEC